MDSAHITNQEKQALLLLQQGKALLEQNDPQKSLAVLQQAYQIIPQNAAIRTLLALSYFKLGHFLEAEKIYLKLIDENPSDTSLHNWLGLVYAKLQRYEDAQKEFAAAGQTEMARKMAQKIEKPSESISSDFLSIPTEHIDDKPSFSLPPSTPIKESPALSVVVIPPIASIDLFSHSERDVPFSLDPMEAPNMQDLPSIRTPPPHKEIPRPPIPWFPDETTAMNLANPFHLYEDGHLLICSRDYVYARLHSMLFLLGNPRIQKEYKRFQGKPIDQPFGPPLDPMIQIGRNGILLLERKEHQHRTLLPIHKGQPAYFCEETILAFTSNISWENGRIPSPVEEVKDFPLDNLWGDGTVVLETKGPLWGFDLQPGKLKRMRVEYHRLAGWIGNLVPRIVIERDLHTGVKEPAFIELEGEGSVFITMR